MRERLDAAFFWSVVLVIMATNFWINELPYGAGMY
jgi:hypothetical protein